MEKSLILSRLRATIKKLKELLPEQFNYGDYVTKFDFENRCGTVCCVAGWYPKWFPKAGFYWSGDSNLKTNSNTHNIIEVLSKYHGLNIGIINALFIGAEFQNILDEIETGNMTKVSLSDVIQRFEIIYSYIKK